MLTNRECYSLWTPDRLKPKEWNRGQAVTYMQHKINGHRLTFFSQPDGRVFAFGRQVEPELEMTCKLGWCDWSQRIVESMPPKSVIDGELYVIGMPPSEVKTAINTQFDALRFRAFAAPWWSGHYFGSDDYDQFRKTRDMVSDTITAGALKWTSDAKYEGQSVEELLKQARDFDIEGFVLKNRHYDGWYKVKEARTCDGFVTGVKEGKGKFKGMIGALIVSAYDRCLQCHGDEKGCETFCQCNGTGLNVVEIASVSGMVDALRSEMTDVNVMGRVCEVAYQYVGSGGRLIHPRFIRWRDDKRQDECVHPDYSA